MEDGDECAGFDRAVLEDAAARAELARLRAANGDTRTYGQFKTATRHGNRPGVQSYMGIADREFLSMKSVDSRLPEAHFSGNKLSLQRSIELGIVMTLQEFLDSEPHKVNTLRNAHGETLLHTAVLHDHLEIVQLLLQRGADPTVALPANGKSQSTLESVAPRSENYKYSRMLNAAEATPVHYACAVGNLETVKLLLAASNRFKLTPPFGVTRAGSLLIWAITAGHPKIVEYLILKKKIETDCFDEDGNNSFGVAALSLGKPVHAGILKDIIKLLVLSESIEINHKNMNGLTAFDTAEETHVKELLRHYGGRSARVLDMERLLRWDREASRLEYTYRRDRLGAIELRHTSDAA